ncbi:MAG TPA: flagellin [Anaerolineaceae bacterium]|nr:flagellin [Anaerolineaceae bacterium]HPN52570.1 flagellin [Anaerolineaceae bacterium]
MATNDINRISGNIEALSNLVGQERINNSRNASQAQRTSSTEPVEISVSKISAHSEEIKVVLSNIGEAKNLLTVSDWGLDKIGSLLERMKGLAEKAGQETSALVDRDQALSQIRQLMGEMAETVKQATWNGNNLLDGSFTATSITIQTITGSVDETFLSGLKNVNPEAEMGLGEKAGQRLVGEGPELTDLSPKSILKLLIPGIIPDAYPVNVAPADKEIPNELASGLYQVEVNVNEAEGGKTFQARLLDAAGNEVAASAVAPYGEGAAKAVFGEAGRGINSVNITPGLDAGSYKVAVGYTRKGDYNINSGKQPALQAPLTNYLAAASEFVDFAGYLESRLSDVVGQKSLMRSLKERLDEREAQIASQPRITDAQSAEDQVNTSKSLITQHVNAAILSQAQSAPQFLLSLFK